LRRYGEDLIRRAFETARVSGKPGWESMSVAVLKNRLLDLTDRTFDEAAWGVTSFQEWVELFTELLAVDRTRKPAWVTLRDTGLPRSNEVIAEPPVLRPTNVSSPRWRIRRDLWQAVVNRRVGQWVWEGGVAQLSATVFGEINPRQLLPTLTTDEMRALRRTFAAGLAGSTDEKEILDLWADDLLPDSVLPHTIRGRWIAALKQAVLERSKAWFAARGLDEPVDLVETSSSRGPSEDPLDELRSLVIRCVQAMTRSELEELRLPPGALLRSSGRRRNDS
jgi:hypothetical protein